MPGISPDNVGTLRPSDMLEVVNLFNSKYEQEE